MSFISNCCGATPYLGSTDYGRCSDCKENCEFIDEESDECICSDNGYFITKSKYIEDQVTKCYECNIYVSDEEAKNDINQVEFDLYEHLENRKTYK